MLSVYSAPEMVILALAGLVIAIVGALAPRAGRRTPAPPPHSAPSKSRSIIRNGLVLRSVRPLLLAGARTGQRDRQIWTVIRPLLTTCVPAHIWPTRGRSGNGRRVHALGSAPVEERCNQREHFAGPQCHADVRGLGEHCELRVRQELEHLRHVRQR